MSVIDQIANELEGRGVHIEVRGDRLWYSPKSAVTPELLEQMMEYRSELLELAALNARCDFGRRSEIRRRGRTDNGQCRLEIDPTLWTIEPDLRPAWQGRLRVTCRVCGRYIGHKSTTQERRGRR